jgi:hypothetical protein
MTYDKIGDKRLELLRNLVGKVGDGTFIEPPFLPDLDKSSISNLADEIPQ